MRNSKSVDELQASMFSKIDQAFTAYYVQMERFKENLKIEMWDKVEQERLKSASEASTTPLRAKLGEIDKLIVDIEKIEVKGAKREILMTLQGNIVQEVNQQLDRYHKEKSTAVEYCKTVDQFGISQTIKEQDIRKIMKLHLPFFQNKDQVLGTNQSESTNTRIIILILYRQFIVAIMIFFTYHINTEFTIITVAFKNIVYYYNISYICEQFNEHRL